jgi:HEAT repeat protein
LSGGDRRSIGRVAEVIAAVQTDPSLFAALFSLITDSDPIVRMRAADATEKLTALHPEWLLPYKTQLLEQIAGSTQQEVRWHVAQMAPRLAWTPEERPAIYAVLLSYLEDASSIVKTSAMQALADLALQYDDLRSQTIPILEYQTATGSPAMRSRGRKLLRLFDRSG